ncbi:MULTISPECIES: NADH-quinone oxidoreductase subunit K [unclassified Methanoregula]|uniref:NADH-quinone oxidoreductase subunit NuoK n=1 Tax=unclassified Methanoregula TaxID=2649730 RepID=UPI0009D58251|nr:MULTISPECIES: NADH-quinone oxidoreductase subunit K [unclassified Methanoregula]OPX64267.1 MAG: NADH:ubiquinone oxidoreductase subunit K [Methanoregula sp. PtaB.Bin085]OPY33608.1 MAG: NADH:ubiquinone oxidoreductase subunit K [Methanoregula sp. PtaU1.Bin006]
MMPGGVVIILIVAAALFATGLFALIARCNLIKMVMGLELLGKAVSLVFILGGYLAGDTGVSQSVVFTLIAIEAVVAGLALALVILARHVWKTFDIAAISTLSNGGER